MSVSDISKNEIVVINIKSFEECPMCYQFLTNDDSLTCPKNIASHRICRNCDLKLKNDYFQNQENNCIYCGDRAGKLQENIVVIPVQIRETNTINQVTVNQSSHFIKLNWLIFWFVIICASCLITAYYMLNACYEIGSSIYHNLFEDHNHYSHEMSLKHACYGFLIWICIATVCTIVTSAPLIIYEKVKSCKCRSI